MVTTALLLALGVFAVVNLLKFFGPDTILPAAKLLLALLLSAAVAVPFAPDAREGALLALGVFGLSTILHGAHKALEALGDERRMETLNKGVRR